MFVCYFLYLWPVISSIFIFFVHNISNKNFLKSLVCFGNAIYNVEHESMTTFQDSLQFNKKFNPTST